MLRAVTFPLFGLSAKFLGFVVMAAGIAIFVALPWLDRSPSRGLGDVYKRQNFSSANLHSHILCIFSIDANIF